MVHEVLLFSVIPAANHDHILRVLAGVAAMQPIPIKEHHLVFKPNRNPASLPTSIPGRPMPAKPGVNPGAKPANQMSGAAAQASNDLFYLQIVGDLTKSRNNSHATVDTDVEEDAEVEADESSILSGSQLAPIRQSQTTDQDDTIMTGTDSTQEETAWSSHPWSLEFKSLPDVLGRRPATSRLISSVPIRNGNARSFIEGLGYSYINAYLIKGHRFTHEYLTIRLYKTYPLANPLPTETDSNPNPAAPSDEELTKLPPLDPSGGYILEVIVRVRDGSKPELMTTAFNEITKFRDLMKGVVDLVPVERLALDTRIKASTPSSGVSVNGIARGGATRA